MTEHTNQAETKTYPNMLVLAANNELLGYGLDFGGYGVKEQKIALTSLWRAIDGDEAYIVKQEVYSDIGVSELGIYLLLKGDNKPVIVDFAEAHAIAVLKRLGINVVKCNKAPGSIEATNTLINSLKVAITSDSADMVAIKPCKQHYKVLREDGGLMDAMRYSFQILNNSKE